MYEAIIDTRWLERTNPDHHLCKNAVLCDILRSYDLLMPLQFMTTRDV